LRAPRWARRGGAARPRASPPSTPRCSPATRTTTSASALRSRGAPAARLAGAACMCVRMSLPARPRRGWATAGAACMCACCRWHAGQPGARQRAAPGRVRLGGARALQRGLPLGAASPGLPPNHPVPVPGLSTYAALLNLGHIAPGRARRARPPAPLSRRGCSARRRGAVRLFAEFFQSDIIVASPLGLATALAAAAGEGDGAGDFLSSVEVAVADRADVMLMQNWAHVATGAPRPAPTSNSYPALRASCCSACRDAEAPGAHVLVRRLCCCRVRGVRACGTASLWPCWAPARARREGPAYATVAAALAADW